MRNMLAAFGVLIVILLPIGLLSYWPGRHGAIAYNLQYREPRAVGSGVTEELLSSFDPGLPIYVPAYSHIYVESGEGTLLTVTLSIRNVHTKHRLILEAVDYFNTEGKVVRRYLESPLLLMPLQTAEYLVGAEDTEGGSGANFLVRWRAEPGAPPPLAEAIMVGKTGAGIVSFSRTGVVVGAVEHAPSSTHPESEE